MTTPSDPGKTGTIIRDAKGRIVKGSGSINPGGRPRGVMSYAREHAGANGEKVFAWLADVMEGRRKVDARQLEAAKELLVRAVGKAPDVQLVGELSDDHTAALAEVSSGDLADLVRHLRSPSLLTVDSVAVPVATNTEPSEAIQSESLEDS